MKIFLAVMEQNREDQKTCECVQKKTRKGKSVILKCVSKRCRVQSNGKSKKKAKECTNRKKDNRQWSWRIQ